MILTSDCDKFKRDYNILSRERVDSKACRELLVRCTMGKVEHFVKLAPVFLNTPKTWRQFSSLDPMTCRNILTFFMNHLEQNLVSVEGGQVLV